MSNFEIDLFTVEAAGGSESSWDEDDAEEEARLEAALAALEAEEEAFAREEAEEAAAEAAAEIEAKATTETEAVRSGHKDVDRAVASIEEAELALTELKDAIALGGESDAQLREEANQHQIKLKKAKGRPEIRKTYVLLARQLARQLRALVPEAELQLKQLHLAEQRQQRLEGRLEELQAEALVCVEGLVPKDGGSRSQVLARLQALGEWAVPGSRMQLFGSTACDLHAHGADLDLTLQPLGPPPSYPEQQALVRHLAQAFQPLQASGEFTLVEAIDHARVPILKLQHAASNLQCDVSVGNELAVQKTRLLHAFVLRDSRVRPLCLIVKHCTPPQTASMPTPSPLFSCCHHQRYPCASPPVLQGRASAI